MLRAKRQLFPWLVNTLAGSAISRVMGALTCLGSGSHRAAGAPQTLLTTAPMLRRQHDLGGQTHEVHGCPSGLVRAYASPHQLSIRRLSADSITAGQRALSAPDCQVALIAVAASPIRPGATFTLSSVGQIGR